MHFASLMLILAALLTFLDDVRASKEVEFCDDYSVCLQKLEVKQRECLKLPVPDSEREQDLSSAGRRRRKEVHRELASLHLRKTELLRDCVADNIDRAEDILDPVKEKKCMDVADKLSMATELLLTTKKPSKKTTKRKELTRQASKTCRKTRQMLQRKCHQLSKCCSIAKECELDAMSVQEQINTLRIELRTLGTNGTRVEPKPISKPSRSKPKPRLLKTDQKKR